MPSKKNPKRYLKWAHRKLLNAKADCSAMKRVKGARRTRGEGRCRAAC